MAGSLLVLSEPASAQQPGTLRWIVPLDTTYSEQPSLLTRHWSRWHHLCRQRYRSRPGPEPELICYFPTRHHQLDFYCQGQLGLLSTVAPDGTIYIGSTDQNLYSINPSGASNWAFHTAGWISSSPALAADGTIYINAQTNFLNQLCG